MKLKNKLDKLIFFYKIKKNAKRQLVTYRKKQLSTGSV